MNFFEKQVCELLRTASVRFCLAVVVCSTALCCCEKCNTFEFIYLLFHPPSASRRISHRNPKCKHNRLYDITHHSRVLADAPQTATREAWRATYLLDNIYGWFSSLSLASDWISRWNWVEMKLKWNWIEAKHKNSKMKICNTCISITTLLAEIFSNEKIQFHSCFSTPHASWLAWLKNQRLSLLFGDSSD